MQVLAFANIREEDMDLLAYLRTQTAECHQRTERQLPFFSHDFTIEKYKSVVAAFYGYLQPFEQRCAPWGAVSAVDLASRSKLPALFADMEALGIDSGRVLMCRNLPDVSTLSRFFGCSYVIEGSTLGGQFISRHLETHFGLGADNGAAYFRGYGAATSGRWKEFRAVVAAREPELDREEALTGATQTFNTLENWLAAIL